MAFNADIFAPEKQAIDRMFVILHEGDPLIHDPLPPAWPVGTPCPAGHYCLPEGAMLYRSDEPVTMTGETIVEIGCEENFTERHLDDDRYWLAKFLVRVIQPRDVVKTGDTSGLLRDLYQLFCVDAGNLDGTMRESAATRLSSATLNVFYIQDMQARPDYASNNRCEEQIEFTLFCSGIVPPPV